MFAPIPLVGFCRILIDGWRLLLDACRSCRRLLQRLLRTCVQGAAYNNNRSTPQPRAQKRHGKSPFLFSICLLRAINLLNNAGNRLSLGIPKAVSVFPAEQGGKTLKSQNSFFWGLCAKWCFSIIIWSPGSQFIIINTIFDREHDAATFSLYRQSKYQLIERFNTIIVTRNCHFFWCKRIFKINQYHTVEGRFFVFIILIGP